MQLLTYVIFHQHAIDLQYLTRPPAVLRQLNISIIFNSIAEEDKMAVVRLIVILRLAGLIFAVSYTGFNFCPQGESPTIVHRQSTVDSLGAEVISSVPGRTIGECVNHCINEPSCFSTLFSPRRKVCDIHPSTINDLRTPKVSPGKEVAQVADAPDWPADNSVESCADRCGAGACRTDCGYDPPQPICFKNLRDCYEEQYNNLDYFYFGKIEWSQSSGTAKEVTFTKKYKRSSLRLSWRGDMRTPTGTGNCIRYALYVNGSDCSDPAPLDSLHYKPAPANNGHRSDGIEGICHWFGDGEVKISMVATACPDINHAAGSVGHVSNSWLLVQEVDAQPQTLEDYERRRDSCNGLSSYGVQTYVTQDYKESAEDYQYGEAMRYYKKEDDTALVITFNGAFMETPTQGTFRCTRWRYLFNGEPCEIEADMTDEHREIAERLGIEQRYGLWKAVCNGISAGVINITLNTTACRHGVVRYNSVTGWRTDNYNGSSRFIVEEIKLDSSVTAGVIRGTNSYSRLPVFNIKHFYVYQWNNGGDNGNMWTMSYEKKSAASGLRAEFNSNARQWRNSYICCRWYFVFNGAECSNPGSLDGIVEDNVAKINHPRQITVDGVCMGLPAGTTTVQLYVGKCPHQGGVSDCKTGYYATTNVLLSEINY